VLFRSLSHIRLLSLSSVCLLSLSSYVRCHYHTYAYYHYHPYAYCHYHPMSVVTIVRMTDVTYLTLAPKLIIVRSDALSFMWSIAIYLSPMLMTCLHRADHCSAPIDAVFSSDNVLAFSSIFRDHPKLVLLISYNR
jgi:hypothetical protein